MKIPFIYSFICLLLLNRQHKAGVLRKKEQLHRQFNYIITKIKVLYNACSPAEIESKLLHSIK